MRYPSHSLPFLYIFSQRKRRRRGIHFPTTKGDVPESSAIQVDASTSLPPTHYREIERGVAVLRGIENLMTGMNEKLLFRPAKNTIHAFLQGAITAISEGKHQYFKEIAI